MKKIKFFILFCLFGMVSIAASAYNFSTVNDDGVTIYYNITSSTNLTCEVTHKGNYLSGDSYSGAVRIPASVTYDSKTYSVTSIGDYAFRNCSGLTSVDIPNTITTIGYEAFAFTNLSGALEIPNGLTSIGGRAFCQCSSITSVTIPPSIVSIGNSAFQQCNGLNAIYISDIDKWVQIHFGSDGHSNPLECAKKLYLNNTLVTRVELSERVEKIGARAFHNYDKLQTIVFPQTLLQIGNSAFELCTSLTSVDIPNSVTSIDGYAFAGCSNIESIKLGNSLTSISQGAFQLINKLTSIEIPQSVKRIEMDAFKGCSNLETIDIPNELEYIYSNPFAGSKWYTNQSDGLLYLNKYLLGYKNTIPSDITIASSTLLIADYSFYNKYVQNLYIPYSVKYIGPWAFYDGPRNIYVKWKKAEDIPAIESFTLNISNATLHVPQDKTSLYQNTVNWNKSKSIVEVIPNTRIVNSDATSYEEFIVSNDELLLEDNIKSIEITERISDVNITYTRNFEKAGVWQAWYMPFDVAFDDMKDAYDVAQIHGVLLDKDNNAVLAFLKLDNGTVKANTPYVVRPKASGEVSIETTTDLQSTVSKSFDLKSATDIYYLGGVYEKTTTPGNWYALNLDGQFQLMGSGVYLRPFRIYMTIDPRDDNPYATSVNANAKMDIVVIGDDETTGIKESLTPALSEGKGAIYNLSGLRVNSIQKGQIYIMNGKKYIAK